MCNLTDEVEKTNMGRLSLSRRTLRVGPSSELSEYYEWAHSQYSMRCCGWYCMGPHQFSFLWAHWHTQLLLPMVSHGPTILTTGAEDSFAWAHWHMQLLLPMVLHGPTILTTGANNSLAWAHWHM